MKLNYSIEEISDLHCDDPAQFGLLREDWLALHAEVERLEKENAAALSQMAEAEHERREKSLAYAGALARVRELEGALNKMKCRCGTKGDGRKPTTHFVGCALEIAQRALQWRKDYES